MRTIKLYGALGKQFGKIHRFDVNSTAEAIRALIANFPLFEAHVIDSEKKNIGYKVFNGQHQIDEKEFAEPISREIRIVPVVIGASGVAKIIVGTVLIVAGVVMSAYGVPGGSFFVNMGAALVLGGISQLLTKNPSLNSNNSATDTGSYIFNGPVNTSQQGLPVPVCYGRLIVGSSVISAGISVDQLMAGFRYVDHLTYQDVVAINVETNYQSSLPNNWIRKELLDHVMSDASYDYAETWYFRFWYNEKVLEAVPV